MTHSDQIIRIAITVALLGMTGCASTPTLGSRPFQPITVLSEDGRFEVTVHGSLMRLEQRTQQQVRWEQWLYGPESVSETRLRSPQGMTVVQGELVVCDQGWPAVLGIDLGDGKLTREIADADLRCPVAVAADEAGTIYIADPTSGVFRATGDDVQPLPMPPVPIPMEPSTLTVHGSILYVADRANRAVYRYDIASNQWVEPVPTSDVEPLGAPSGLAAMDGMLYLADAIKGLVYRIPLDGKSATIAIERGRRPGDVVRPIGLCATTSGILAVVDAGQQLVNLYDEEGSYVMSLVGRDGWQGFTLPGGIACLPGAPLLLDLASEDDDREWIAVSDLLGPQGIVLFSIRRGH